MRPPLALCGVVLASVASLSPPSHADTKAPYMAGEVWWVSRGSSQCGHQANAYDFNSGAGCDDLGKPILSPVKGLVITASCDAAEPDWGRTVIVDDDDDTGYARVAHLDAIFVRVGDRVEQGQVLGLCGSTGNSTAPHVHYQYQATQSGGGIEYPLSDIGIPTGPPEPECCLCDDGDHQYVSRNTRMLDQAYDRNGGSSRIGDREYNMWELDEARAANPSHPWYLPWTSTGNYRADDTATNCFIQHLNGGFYWDGVLIYDGLAGAGKAYVLHSGFWVTWTTRGGPSDATLGLPITDEYSQGAGEARQDFQLGYLYYKQGRTPDEITVNKYPYCAPGMTAQGWDATGSYRIAQNYESRGARNHFGEPTGYAYRTGSVWRQLFQYDSIELSVDPSGSFACGNGCEGGSETGGAQCTGDPGSLISNGEFSNGSECWEFINPENRAVVSDLDRIEIQVLQAGGYAGVQLRQGVAVTQGQQYRLVQRLEATNPTTVTVALVSPMGEALGLWRDVPLEGTNDHVEILFTAAETSTDALLTYYVGQSATTLRLDAVRLETTSGITVSPATCLGDGSALVANGGFDGSVCWTVNDYYRRGTYEFIGQLHVSLGGGSDVAEVYQLAPVAAEHDYRMSFDAHSSDPTTIIVAVQKKSDPWRQYGLWERVELSATTFHFDQVFTADTTDASARVTLSFMEASGEIWIDNVRFEEVICTKDPGSLIGGGQFTSTDCWRFQHRPADRFETVQEERDVQSAHLTVAAAGEQWETQLYQERIRVSAGKRYRLSCEVKGSNPLSNVNFQLAIKPIPPDTVWKHVLLFDQSPTDDYVEALRENIANWSTEDARLSFAVGDTSGEYWIRNVRLEEHENCPRQLGNAVASGDFVKAGCWRFEDHAGDGSFETVDQGDGTYAAHCVVNTPNPEFWWSQLLQDAVVLDARWRYRLTAEVKGSLSGSQMFLQLAKPSSAPIWYEVFGAPISLTDAWTPVAIVATSDSTTPSGRLAFAFGRTAGEYRIRNVTLTILPDSAGTRNKYKQPFASRSIWNMPIGSGAVYIDAELPDTSAAAIDVDYWIETKASDPLRAVYDASPGWTEPRCKEAPLTGDSTYFPDDLLIADATFGFYPSTPNNSAAILQPDAETLVQLNALARCSYAGPVYGIPVRDSLDQLFAQENIYREGITGAHGGSLLSSIGGTIRVGELVAAEPIPHVLKVDIWGERDIWPQEGGYRWPAVKSDICWSHNCSAAPLYGGHVPALRMGALLAIPPWVTEDYLGLQTAVGKKLFRALQDYGAYVADNSAWNAYNLCIESGVKEEIEAFYGYSIDTFDRTAPYYQDLNKLFAALHVVDNNSESTVGGGGEPRVPLAPELNPSTDAILPADVTATPVMLSIRRSQPSSLDPAFEINAPKGSRAELLIFAVNGHLAARLYDGTVDDTHTSVRWYSARGRARLR